VTKEVPDVPLVPDVPFNTNETFTFLPDNVVPFEDMATTFKNE